MKPSILLLSWRDYYNPKKGGAEVFDYEILKRLAKKGYDIVWLAPAFPGCKKEEVIDGITYVRVGKFYSIHQWAIRFFNRYCNMFDIVIDELHGYPFFTNFYVDKPRITIVHEVAGEIWFKMLKFPISIIGFVFEKIFFRFLYNHSFICPSESTKDDLQKHGIKKEDIFIVNEGTNTNRVKGLEYSKNDNQICFVGRICKMKGVTDLINAFNLVVKEMPEAKLILTGKVDPIYKFELDELIKNHNLYDKIAITGFVTDKEREEIMKESKFLVSCSIKEGFGLIVVEANSLGTPAITYNVHGYKDIIVNNKTGYLVEKGNIKELSKVIIKGLRSKSYKEMQLTAWETSKKYNWNNAANDFEEILIKTISLHRLKNQPNKLSKISVNLMFMGTKLLGDVASKFKLA